jgi:hypothetical protein
MVPACAPGGNQVTRRAARVDSPTFGIYFLNRNQMPNREMDMTEVPALDQVADARRKLAAHAGFPVAYWVALAAAIVLMAGLPIWMSLFPDGITWLQWGLAAIALGSAAYTVLRRRSSGVHLPRRVTSYPGARMVWAGVLTFTVAGYFGVKALVDSGNRGVALAVLLPFAAVVLVGQMSVRKAMRRDIEAGRVTP